jgi:predicted Rossmann fold flavoprotein
MSETTDVIIIGAGAAGLMCAIEAGRRGRRVVVLDHANKAGKKILMSGGGRCNFTNTHTQPDHFISHNPHFCKSALSRYTPWDFIELVQRHQIAYHEKAPGQLFCDNSSKDIVQLLLTECEKNQVSVRLNSKIELIDRVDNKKFSVRTMGRDIQCHSLVIATGGLSIPTMGASPFGYQIAQQFALPVWPTRAGLVPLTLHVADKERLTPLTGIAVECIVTSPYQQFHENILFTHRGLSGPAILQISSYWNPGEALEINLLPQLNLLEHLIHLQHTEPRKQIKTILANYLPKHVVEIFLPAQHLEKPLHMLTRSELQHIAQIFTAWRVVPNATEGYRTAEVTLGGVDCDALSSKTMEVLTVPNLYFIGEVVDVTGWLGGFNFQWAWSSGWAAGQVV